MRHALVLLVLVLAAVAARSAWAASPNDPAWSDEWAQRVMRVPEVWDYTTGDPGIVIATIDTGADEFLPDLAGAFVPGWDFVENDAEAQDVHGHGTHVASVIAARGNNGIGMAGYCWRCRIMPVRVSADGQASSDLIAAGIRWAVDHGARIVNVSLSAGGPADDTEREAVKYASDRGVLVVASAGNAANDLPRYPAAFPGVLSVAATDDSDHLYFWSTRGEWVTLAAAGCQMVLDPAVGAGTLCGTSFTPAAVSGIAGLMLSLNPALTAQQVARALRSSAVPVAGIGGGRVDAYGALAALGLVPPTPSQPPVPPPQAPSYSRQAQIESGTLRASRRIGIRVGEGPIDLELASPGARECTISLSSPGSALVASPEDQNLVGLSATVPAGRYTVEIRCRTRRRKSYTLAITAMFRAS